MNANSKKGQQEREASKNSIFRNLFTKFNQAMAEGSSKRITVTVKTPKEKENIECDEEETVEKVKLRLHFLIINLLKP